MKAPWAPVRRNRRPEAHFGSQGANFSENRCNRQSARRGVRIRHPWRREAAGRSGRPEKRDGQRCQLGPQHKMFLVGPGPDNSVEPTQLSDVSNRAPLPAQGVDHVGRCPLRHNASHTPAGSTAAGAPTAEMVRVLKKCEVARSPEDRSCRHVVEHVCLLGPTLAELIRTFGWPPSRTQQIPPRARIWAKDGRSNMVRRVADRCHSWASAARKCCCSENPRIPTEGVALEHHLERTWVFQTA